MWWVSSYRLNLNTQTRYAISWSQKKWKYINSNSSYRGSFQVTGIKLDKRCRGKKTTIIKTLAHVCHTTEYPKQLHTHTEITIKKENYKSKIYCLINTLSFLFSMLVSGKILYDTIMAALLNFFSFSISISSINILLITEKTDWGNSNWFLPLVAESGLQGGIFLRSTPKVHFEPVIAPSFWVPPISLKMEHRKFSLSSQFVYILMLCALNMSSGIETSKKRQKPQWTTN